MPADIVDGGGEETRFVTALGDFELIRYPQRPRVHLRGWDAADSMLVDELATTRMRDAVTGTVVVLNDTAGALTVGAAALAADLGTGTRILSIADRYTARRSIVENVERSRDRLGQVDVEVVADADGLDGLGASVLLFRPLRSLAMFEHQLRALRSTLGPTTTVLGTSMVKHLHSSTLEVLESTLGPTTTSLARRRARLIHVEPDGEVLTTPWPWPRTDTLGPAACAVTSLPGVFSAGKLDAGTELLIEHLPDPGPDATVIDLGCGNGVIAAHLLAARPDARLTCVDDSYAATQSCAATLARLDPPAAPLVVNGNGLEAWPDGSSFPAATADLVVCNPPFHDDHALGDAIAWQMFSESRRALRPGGELLIVGNRHLGYHTKLQRLFGNHRVVASDRRFVVMSAQRR